MEIKTVTIHVCRARSRERGRERERKRSAISGLDRERVHSIAVRGDGITIETVKAQLLVGQALARRLVIGGGGLTKITDTRTHARTHCVLFHNIRTNEVHLVLWQSERCNFIMFPMGEILEIFGYKTV